VRSGLEHHDFACRNEHGMALPKLSDELRPSASCHDIIAVEANVFDVE